VKAVGRKLHLWLGLLFGGFFVVLGLTGSAIAWLNDFDRALNDDLLQVAPPPGMAAGAEWRVDPTTVQRAVDRLAHDPHYGRPSLLMFPEHAGDVFIAWYRPPAPPGSPWTQEVARQVMLNPITLAVTGERNWGEVGLSRRLLMPTIYHLHRYLVAGEAGRSMIGIGGLAMLLAALSGLVLWWPKPTRSAVWKAITIRHGGSWPRFSFRLHRAVGFFAVPVLLTLGFSGSYFNLPAWIVPAVNAVAPVTPTSKIVNRSKDTSTQLQPARAVALAQAEFPLARPSRISFPPKPGAPYEIRVRQPGELRHGDGATRVIIDSGDGALLRVHDPVRAQGGDKFVSWLFPLHSGEAFGLAGRVFISGFGLVPLIFFVTGLVLWSKRRTASSDRQ
jgi:uncharacterized iron-regulated membrane protein